MSVNESYCFVLIHIASAYSSYTAVQPRLQRPLHKRSSPSSSSNETGLLLLSLARANRPANLIALQRIRYARDLRFHLLRLRGRWFSPVDRSSRLTLCLTPLPPSWQCWSAAIVLQRLRFPLHNAMEPGCRID